MQTGHGPARAAHPRPRFVPPAGSGMRGHPLLIRGAARSRACIPQAALAAARREPLAAVRHAARSLILAPAVPAHRGSTLPRASLSWVGRRRLRDDRIRNAIPWPG